MGHCETGSFYNVFSLKTSAKAGKQSRPLAIKACPGKSSTGGPLRIVEIWSCGIIRRTEPFKEKAIRYTKIPAARLIDEIVHPGSTSVFRLKKSSVCLKHPGLFLSLKIARKFRLPHLFLLSCA
jgi:hypothetical protein